MQIDKNLQINGWSCSPKHGPAHFTVLKTIFVWMVLSFSKTLDFMAGPCSPKTAQFYSRCWKIFSFDVMQIVNNVRLNSWSCFPKHGSAHFTVLKHLCVWMVWSFSNTIKFPAGPFLFQHGPVFFNGVKDPFGLDNLQLFKTKYVYGWAALPNIPCHGPAHFAALSNFFIVMLCRLLTTFKSTAGRAPPNTIQLLSRS